MAKQRYINTHFWDDNYIVTLDPIEKLLFLYFLTNPLTEISGAYEIPLRRIAFDTGIDKDMVLKILGRFADEDRIIYKDGWILLCNFIKHQSDSPKITSGIETSIKACPQWIRDRVSIQYQTLSHLNSNINRDSNLKSNSIETPVDAETEQDGFSKPNWDYPLLPLVNSFPEIEFMPAQIGFIEAEVKDTPTHRDAWAATIKLYRQNYDPINRSYVPTKTGTLLSVFRDEVIKLENRTKTKTKSNSNAYVGKETRTPEQLATFVPDPPCSICGKDICFSNHYNEVVATI